MSAAPIPRDWPHARFSQIVSAGGVSWHVQRMGSGPVLFLVHGTGASTHSFRGLADRLSGEFEIVMADLPGHGFTSPLQRPSLPSVSQALGALLNEIGAEPVLAAGHSAGAAVIIRMTLDKIMSPRALIGFAPALQPYGGAAEGLASKAVKLALLNPFAPRLLAAQANARKVSRLISKTGSSLDAAGTALYTRLIKKSDHVAGTLRLMANWQLRPLLDDLKALDTPLTLVSGDADSATPPADIDTAARACPGARRVRLTGLGHLAHEEDPDAAADIVRNAAFDAGMTGSDPQAGRLHAEDC